MNDSVAKMSERFELLTSQMTAQSDTHVETLNSGIASAQESQRQALDLVDEMHKTAEQLLSSLTTASEHTSRASHDLRTAADVFGERSRGIESALSSTTEHLSQVSTQQQQALQFINSYSDQIESIGVSLKSTSEEIRSAAEVSRMGYTNLEKHQVTFLESLENKFSDMSRTFESRVDSSNTTMNKWLSDYSNQVKAQTDERMNKWNDHTRDFSSNMLDVTTALTEIVDEMERNGRALQTNSA